MFYFVVNIFFQEEPQTEGSTEEGFDIVDPVTSPVEQAPVDESDPFADISQANADIPATDASVCCHLYIGFNIFSGFCK